MNTDMRIARAFTIHERLRTELSIEAFNLFNHQNYTICYRHGLYHGRNGGGSDADLQHVIRQFTAGQ